MSIAAPDRVYAQYRTKPKALAWYGITGEVITPLNTTTETIRKMYNIDDMVGEQLNIIGRIVVLSRVFENTLTNTADSFGTDTVGFGEEDIQFNALTGVVDENVSDDVYRILLKAKININNGDATTDNILRSILIIAPDSLPRIVDNENYTFAIEFGQPLTDVERFIFNTFDVVPKPQTVSFTGFTEV